MSRTFRNPVKFPALRHVYCRGRKASCVKKSRCTQCLCFEGRVYIKESNTCVRPTDAASTTEGIYFYNGDFTSCRGIRYLLNIVAENRPKCRFI